ncbi:MAG: transcriptional regulator [Alteromonadaceae bacterium]|nr:transcriptional regulator [Alteromonadaceae bacterium]|tara:strand:- start:3768 stop:4115 length:348 start_codon:yes stop_codon:yes gene_type:complete
MSADKFFKCLADETRLRCLALLHSRDALCVCDLTEALGTSQPKISRHLAQLRACDLVSDHREGQWVFYRLHPDLAPWQLNVLNSTHAALASELTFREDLRRLEAAEYRKPATRCP